MTFTRLPTLLWSAFMLSWLVATCASSNNYHHNQLRTLKDTQKDVKDYALWDASEFPQVLDAWTKDYPDMIQVTTAQEKYGLPTAGTAKDCPFYEKSDGCPNYIFTIQDFVAHPEGSDSSNNLPEVFWSGCLHGNERVGPTSVMEAASLLLESAHCEALPRRGNNEKGNLEEQLKQAQKCRKTLRNKGIDDVHRRWLARLVTTRRIVVVPTANALGYFRNARTEDGIDPNRDFPYDVEDPALCMQTIAGRTLNEIYREHMFQLALTFHAGMEVVGYEWGAPTWLNHLAPDDEAQSQIGSGYSRYGGGWSKSRPYQYGTMNDLVYYVRGGMEDWAYAGSWTPKQVQPCEPKQFGGYPKEKTTYNNSTLRVFNMLIETSDKKEPHHHLGSSLDVLEGETEGNGHVSRNIRLALLAAEMVEPYAAIVAVNQLALSDDIVPLTNRKPKSCMDNKAVMVAKNAKIVDVEWTVGGSMTVDNTQLWFAKWDDVGGDVDCWTHLSETSRFQKAKNFKGIVNGTGHFSPGGSLPFPSSSQTGHGPTIGPLFRATIPLDNFKKGDRIVVIASAKVDQSWKNQPKNIAPNMLPQSHIVNARTNADYHHESSGKHIHGRIDWYSVPLTITIGDFDDSVGTRDEDLVNTIELHPRFGDTTNAKGGTKPKGASTDQLWFPVAGWMYLAVGLLFLVSVVCCIRFCCTTQQGRILLKNSDEFEDASDDFVFDAKPYSDRVADEYGDVDDEEEEEDGIEIPSIS